MPLCLRCHVDRVTCGSVSARACPAAGERVAGQRPRLASPAQECSARCSHLIGQGWQNESGERWAEAVREPRVVAVCVRAGGGWVRAALTVLVGMVRWLADPQCSWARAGRQ